jgi:hypothetical protein
MARTISSISAAMAPASFWIGTTTENSGPSNSVTAALSDYWLREGAPNGAPNGALHSTGVAGEQVA